MVEATSAREVLPAGGARAAKAASEGLEGGTPSLRAAEPAWCREPLRCLSSVRSRVFWAVGASTLQVAQPPPTLAYFYRVVSVVFIHTLRGVVASERAYLHFPRSP